jgi:hypothetical protein
MHSRTATAVLAVLISLAVGCGGDDETTSGSTTEPTTTAAPDVGLEEFESGGGLLPDDFAADASAICERGQTAVRQIFLGLGSDASSTELSEAVREQIVPTIQGLIDDIRALGEPDKGGEELAAFLDEAQSVLDDVEDNPNSVFTGSPFADVSKQAVHLGIPACAG